MFASILAVHLVISGPTMETPQSVQRIQREFRAAWIATVDNIDWPTRRDLTVASQKAELLALLDSAQKLKLNAVILQVRPSCDALYDSRLEPWSEYLTGAQGKAPEPSYDPLEFAIKEAHARGIELHAWFNPYRAKHPAQKGPLAKTHIANTHPDAVATYGTYLWLDPGHPAAAQRSLDVFLDVVRRYDLDGIHIDDYFYPYPVRDASGKEVPFPDDKSYAKYRSGGGKLGRDDWRRWSVDTFIQKVFVEKNKLKPWVKFGISPFGIYRPGHPQGIQAGIDQYAQLYADCLKWYREGWCDYLTPQLYWPIEQAPQSYTKLLAWWSEQNVKNIHLWPGNFTSRLLESNNNWTDDEIERQIRATRAQKGATGNVHFSMKALSRNARGLADRLAKGLYSELALPPASPWIDRVPPAAPDVTRQGNALKVRPGSGRNEDLKWWVLYARKAGVLQAAKVTPFSESAEFDLRTLASAGWDIGAVAVSAVDRAGNESPVARS